MNCLIKTLILSYIVLFLVFVYVVGLAFLVGNGTLLVFVGVGFAPFFAIFIIYFIEKITELVK